MQYRIAAFADEADRNIGGQIRAMARNGISLLEIRGVDGENIADISPEKAREVRRMLDDAGMRVWSLGSPFGKIGIEEDFVPHLEKFRHSLETAHILGAANIRLFSFYCPSGKAEAFRDKVTDRLAAFIEAARSSGVTLCHENEKGIFGDTALRCAEIHRDLPELRAVFDPANFIQCGQDTKEAWEMLSQYVAYMHIKDALPDGHVVPAGKGEGNIPFLLGRYKGQVLTVEPHLAVFEGLEALEGKDKTKMAYSYPSAGAAFDAAVESLKALLKTA